MWRRARPCSFSGLAGGDVDSFTRRDSGQRIGGHLARRAQQRFEGEGWHLEIDDEAVEWVVGQMHDQVELQALQQRNLHRQDVLL